MKILLVIFGVTGDLAGRKLLPALDSIVASNQDGELSILGVSRREVRKADIFGTYPRLEPLSDTFTMDVATLGEYQRLKTRLDEVSADTVLFYLAVPPGAAADIVDFLGQAGLNKENHRILFEKPFGYDLESAKDFVERTKRYYDEDTVYRIDHYMAKEIAVELVRLRRNAENYHHHWSNESVKSVTVVASEAIGIEGRGQFYEQTGALRDFVQGHLMQLLSLVLIDRPGQRPLPKERLAALSLLRPSTPTRSARGQYMGYQEEAGNRGSTVETFAFIELESNDPRWQGVPLRLITGKALAHKRSYITIDYTDGSSDVFDETAIVARNERNLDAYERVLLEAMAGNKDIFTTSEEVIRSWEVLAPVQEAWAMDMSDIIPYESGLSVEALLAHKPQN